MSAVESLFFWSATLTLAVTFFLVVMSLVFLKPGVYRTARLFSFLAFLLITVFGIMRWTASSHPPFVTLFESMVNSVWFLLLIFHSMAFKSPRYSIVLLPLSLLGFLLMGWSSSLPTAASPLSLALENVWLFIHASFATSGAAVFLAAASMSTIYLLGPERLATMEKVAAKVPEYNSLPTSITNFLIFGLILWGVMIVSGSIWAHSAWGRYWAWDPIELWSLISWLLFGLLLHARLAFKLSRRLFCRLTIIAAATVVFALWGVGYIYETIHSYG